MTIYSIHAAPKVGAPEAIIADRLGWWRFLLLPLWLLKYGLLLRFGIWAFSAVFAIVAAWAGLLSTAAAWSILLLVQWLLALEAPEARRGRLWRQGRPIEALVDGERLAPQWVAHDIDAGVPAWPGRGPPPLPRAAAADGRVIGLFPKADGRGRG
jgi:hypothetical protein